MSAQRARTFLSDEDGAVTIPWIVLAAAVFGISVIVIEPVGIGAQNLTRAVSLQLGGTTDKTEFK